MSIWDRGVVEGSEGGRQLRILRRSSSHPLSQKLGSEKLDAIVNNAVTSFSHGTSHKEILDTNTRAYAGSKALLASYTSQLAKQHPNITTTILSPGWIKTAMTEGQGASEPPAEASVC
eukprot:scaffold569_cov220-Alexandrium_tamarense.AAC.6